MATKIKLNTIDAQINFIDETVAEATGIDLRQYAREAIERRNAIKNIGLLITNAVMFDEDNSVVLVKSGALNILH